MIKIESHVRAGLFGAVAAGGLILGTTAVVRAQPLAPSPIVAPTVTGVPAVIKAAIDAMKPVQLPTWTSMPTEPCTEGQAVMFMRPNNTNSAGDSVTSRLAVCVGVSQGTCLQTGTRPHMYCAATDQGCTASGGAPVGGSTAYGVTCSNTNYSRGCAKGSTTYCAQYSTSFTTRWQAVALSPTPP
jgi:hypothetical protein